MAKTKTRTKVVAQPVETIESKLSRLEQQTAEVQEQLRLKQTELETLRDHLAQLGRQEQRAADDVTTFAEEIKLRERHVQLVTGAEADVIEPAITSLDEGKTHFAELQRILREAREASAAEETRVTEREAILRQDIDQALDELSNLSRAVGELREIVRRSHTDKGNRRFGRVQATYERLVADRDEAQARLVESQKGLSALRLTAESELADWPELRKQASQMIPFDDTATQLLTTYINLIDFLLEHRNSMGPLVRLPYGNNLLESLALSYNEVIEATGHGAAYSLLNKKERLEKLLEEHHKRL